MSAGNRSIDPFVIQAMSSNPSQYSTTSPDFSAGATVDPKISARGMGTFMRSADDDHPLKRLASLECVKEVDALWDTINTHYMSRT
jgi:hypothetical protein